MRGEKPRFALLAQLDRVTDYESVGQGFESLAAHHIKALTLSGKCFFVYVDSESQQPVITAI